MHYLVNKKNVYAQHGTPFCNPRTSLNYTANPRPAKLNTKNLVSKTTATTNTSLLRNNTVSTYTFKNLYMTDDQTTK